jgi:hypothetical protein
MDVRKLAHLDARPQIGSIFEATSMNIELSIRYGLDPTVSTMHLRIVPMHSIILVSELANIFSVSIGVHTHVCEWYLVSDTM